MKETMEKEYIRNREYQSVIKDGSKIPVEMSASEMYGTDGEPIGFVGISRDITERKRAEEKRIEAERKEARAEEAEKFTKQLEAKVKDLEEFRDLAVGRELKMKKMEEEMEELKRNLEDKGG